MAERRLLVSVSPHIRGEDDIPRIMWAVVYALLPALAGAYLFFGWRALLVTALAGGAAVGTEFAIQYLRGERTTVSDGSALVAGILLAFCLPPNIPLYVPVLGSVFAMAIAKHAMGGLGCNVWNPALAARAFLLASFPTHVVMPKWPVLRSLAGGDAADPIDALTRATPLAVLKQGEAFGYHLWELATGWIPGCIGETSAAALLLGGLYLIYKGYVDWRLPASYLLTVAVSAFVLPAKAGSAAGAWFSGPVGVHLLGGGLFLGAFFMATDMVTSPLTRKGQVLFGIGCGLLTVLIRLYGGYPEGVCYAILIMNTCVPLIDRFTRPRVLGE